ncbi:unnamed protein product, partial [Rotaria magnacalcarata]
MTASVHLFVDALDAIENENFNEAVRLNQAGFQIHCQNSKTLTTAIFFI